VARAHAARRQPATARAAGLHAAADPPRPGRPPARVRHVLRGHRRVRGHARRPPRHPGAGALDHRAGPRLRVVRRGVARPELRAPRRPRHARGRDQPQPAHAAPLPAAAARDARRGPAHVRRPVRAARHERPQVHPRAERGGWRWCRRPRSARTTSIGDEGGLRGRLDRRLPAARQGGRRLHVRQRVRRAPLRAAQPQRRLRERDHAGPRVRPRDALAPRDAVAAVPDRRLLAVRRRGGVHVQRGAADAPPAQAGEDRRGAPVPARLRARGPAHDLLPAGDVRRVRARHPRQSRSAESHSPARS
jgi:hypothetical protein